MPLVQDGVDDGREPLDTRHDRRERRYERVARAERVGAQQDDAIAKNRRRHGAFEHLRKSVGRKRRRRSEIVDEHSHCQDRSGTCIAPKRDAAAQLDADRRSTARPDSVAQRAPPSTGSSRDRIRAPDTRSAARRRCRTRRACARASHASASTASGVNAVPSARAQRPEVGTCCEAVHTRHRYDSVRLCHARLPNLNANGNTTLPASRIACASAASPLLSSRMASIAAGAVAIGEQDVDADRPCTGPVQQCRRAPRAWHAAPATVRVLRCARRRSSR